MSTIPNLRVHYTRIHKQMLTNRASRNAEWIWINSQILMNGRFYGQYVSDNETNSSESSELSESDIPLAQLMRINMINNEEDIAMEADDETGDQADNETGEQANTDVQQSITTDVDTEIFDLTETTDDEHLDTDHMIDLVEMTDEENLDMIGGENVTSAMENLDHYETGEVLIEVFTVHTAPTFDQHTFPVVDVPSPPQMNIVPRSNTIWLRRDMPTEQEPAVDRNIISYNDCK